MRFLTDPPDVDHNPFSVEVVHPKQDIPGHPSVPAEEIRLPVYLLQPGALLRKGKHIHIRSSLTGNRGTVYGGFQPDPVMVSPTCCVIHLVGTVTALPGVDPEMAVPAGGWPEEKDIPFPKLPFPVRLCKCRPDGIRVLHLPKIKEQGLRDALRLISLQEVIPAGTVGEGSRGVRLFR